MRQFLLTLIATVVGVTVFAQSNIERPKFEWGARASLGVNQHYYLKGAYDGKPGFAWDAGLIGQWNFSNSFGLRTGLAFQHRMAKMGTVGSGETFNMSSYGVNVPLELVWLSTREFPLYIFAGGYYSGVLGARQHGEKISTGGLVRKNEWGIRYGVGVDLTRRFAVEISAQQALSNVFDIDPKIRNYSAGVSFVYKF